MKHIFLYGPPGSGKTTVGKILAEELGCSFLDLDINIEQKAGKTIAAIIYEQGEAAFRELESEALQETSNLPGAVIALGGGALLREQNRRCAEAGGQVVYLEADLETLRERLQKPSETGMRPLLNGDMEQKLTGLLEKRREHYNSFDLRVATLGTPKDIAWVIQRQVGAFHLAGERNGYDILIQPGGLEQVGELLAERGLAGPIALITDSNVQSLYAEKVQASLKAMNIGCELIVIPAGEANKTLETVSYLWEKLLKAGMDRKSTVVALGGGVVGDLAGFAASTFMRGMAWVDLPTSLLAMVDSSIGGKTGFDLAYGKNLVGAFHSPRLVLADPTVLCTLPQAEFRSGMGEVIKHGIIADETLFELCSHGEAVILENLTEIVRRAIAVKVKYIQIDPYEENVRAALNYGHTVGHAVELVSGFTIRHGEAVAIGMVTEARLAEALGLAMPGLSSQIQETLEKTGLPTQIPTKLSRPTILETMKLDKKKRAGKIRFALPIKIGEVRSGIELDNLEFVLGEE